MNSVECPHPGHPDFAGSPWAARVVMNEMLSAELQALKLEQVGVPSVVDISNAGVDSDYRLTDFAGQRSTERHQQR